jgi:hypothetical protein
MAYHTQASAVQVHLKILYAALRPFLTRASQSRDISSASTCPQHFDAMEDSARLSILAALYVTHVEAETVRTFRQQAGTRFHNRRTGVLPRRLITAS